KFSARDALADPLPAGVDRRRGRRRRRFCGRSARPPGARRVCGAGLHSAQPATVSLFAAFTPDEWTAIRLSLRVAFWAMVWSVPVGVAIALVLARRRFWGKALLNAIVHLPLVMPPVVTGYLLLLAFGRRAPLGAFLAETFGIVFAFRWTGAALACAV